MHKHSYKHDHAPARGYTLLEMIVSVGLFSIVMLLAAGAYFTIIRNDRQARAVNDVVGNLSFAVDSIGREIRTGTGYKCNNSSATPTCSGGGTSFGYTDSSGRTVVYSRQQVNGNGQILASINGVASALTDPRINVETLTFYVFNVGTGDGLQPRVIITMKGTITPEQGKPVSFNIQTTATQRFLEL